MARWIERQWRPQATGLTPSDRQGGTYATYVPDLLTGWQLALPADLAAEIAEAEEAVRALGRLGADHIGSEGLARFLLRAESLGSSRIEGIGVGAGRLARAEAAMAHGGDPRDRIAVEILANISAMEAAVSLAAEAPTFGEAELLEVHRVLMEGSPTPEIAGRIRDVQNWIGGSSFNPCRAEFVPPPPGELPALLDDLFTYIDGDEHSPLVQAALAHAQFETLHPFVDGNGRTGRALIHFVFRRRGLAAEFVPPISLILATWSEDYISGLTAFRHEGAADSDARNAGAVEWLRVFVSATLRACRDAECYSVEIARMGADWRGTLGRVRRDSSLDRLLGALPGVPILTVESAAGLVGRTRSRAAEAIDRLVDAEILVQRNVGRERYRVFEAKDVLELFTSLERALASPAGDTNIEPPNRPVPRPPE